MVLIGYARVSTDEQDTTVQAAALRAAGCTVIIEVKASGGSRERPNLARALQTVGRGDTLVVVRIDRLARSLSHLLEIVEALRAKGAYFRSIHDPIDTSASATHFDRAAIRIRAQLVAVRTSMANQLRGLLKLFGLRLGSARAPAKRNERLVALYAQRPDLQALFAPLIASMEAVEAQLRASDRVLTKRAASDPVAHA